MKKKSEDILKALFNIFISSIVQNTKTNLGKIFGFHRNVKLNTLEH